MGGQWQAHAVLWACTGTGKGACCAEVEQRAAEVAMWGRAAAAAAAAWAHVQAWGAAEKLAALTSWTKLAWLLMLMVPVPPQMQS